MMLLISYYSYYSSILRINFSKMTKSSALQVHESKNQKRRPPQLLDKSADPTREATTGKSLLSLRHVPCFGKGVMIAGSRSIN